MKRIYTCALALFALVYLLVNSQTAIVKQPVETFSFEGTAVEIVQDKNEDFLYFIDGSLSGFAKITDPNKITLGQLVTIEGKTWETLSDFYTEFIQK